MNSLTGAGIVWNWEVTAWLECLGDGGTETLRGWSGRGRVLPEDRGAARAKGESNA
jgi:hypothetical protein